MRTISTLLITIGFVAFLLMSNPAATNAARQAPDQGEGLIAGTVTDDSSGLPIANILVLARSYAGWVAQAHTNDLGQYQISLAEIESGYVINFSDQNDNYIEEWYDDVPYIDLATWVYVTSGETVTVNAQIHKKGLITGTVTDQQSGLPISGISVGFMHGTGGSSTTTDALGHYQMHLLEGENRISFYDETGKYLSEWYDNAASHDEATVVQVQSGQTFVANAQLAEAGVISGSVTLDTPTMPLGTSIDLYAYNVLSPTPWQSWDILDGRTTFRLGDLHTGTYKIKSYYIVKNSSVVDDYSIAYYDLKLAFSEATDINVTEGATTTINIDLSNLGQICGTLTDYFASQPVPHLFEVQALHDGETIAAAHTDSSGHYCLSHLAPGNYAVLFTGDVWPEECTKYCTAAQLYPEQQFPDMLALSRGQVISGIDANIMPYQIFIPLITQ
jgi:hypothetical protein